MKKSRILLCMLAVCMVVSMFSGCSQKEISSDETVKLIWYVPSAIDSERRVEVLSKVNEKLSDVKIELDIVGIDEGNYEQKMQVMNAGREEYDLCFVSGWLNDYYQNVSNGALLDITELVPEYAPKLYESMPEHIWKGIEVGGKLYGVPNWQMMAKNCGVFTPKEKAEAAGVDFESITTIEETEKYLEELHKVDPECNKINPYWNMIATYYGFTDLLKETLPGAIRYNEVDNLKVINQYETEEFEEYIKMRRRWVEKGLCTDAYVPDNNASDKNIKQRPLHIHNLSPNATESLTKSNGYEWIGAPLSPALISSNSINSAMTAVSSTSKHPEKAVQLLEIVNTDPEIYNLLVWGIEGVDYNKLENGKIERIKGGYSINLWKIGSAKNALLTKDQADDIWEQIEEFNDSAIPSPTLGFVPDTTPIATEMANCITVLNEQLDLLDLGLVEPEEGIKKLRESLKTAGADRIVEELQRQIDEWVSQNK